MPLSSAAWSLGLNTWFILGIWLDSFHKRCHIRWYGYVSNDEVLHCSGLLAASSIVHKRRLGLFGHVARLHDDVSANQILHTCCGTQDGVWPSSDWKLPQGLPPTTLIHQIRRETGILMTDALKLAADKSFWRQITTAEHITSWMNELKNTLFWLYWACPCCYMYSPSEGPCCLHTCGFVPVDQQRECLPDMECSNASYCKYPFGIPCHFVSCDCEAVRSRSCWSRSDP